MALQRGQSLIGDIMRGAAHFPAPPAFQREGEENMKSKEVLLLAVCLTAIAPVAQTQSTTQTADPQAQSLKGVMPLSIEPALQQQQSQPKAETKPPRFDNEQYQFGILTRGPKWTAENTPEIQKIQEGHMANINKMAQAGKLFAAGPILDNGDMRGIFIFRAASIDEAKALAAEDPAIKAERLKLEILPWFGSKGIGVKAAEEHKKDPDMKWTMKKYHLAILKRGHQTTQPPAEAQKIQLEHLWNIRRMMDEGKMLTAGPFMKEGDLRGIFVLNTESAEEAKAWAEADPAVKAGWLIVEIHPWLVAKEVWP